MPHSHAASHLPQSIQASLLRWTRANPILEKGFRHAASGQRYLQKANGTTTARSMIAPTMIIVKLPTPNCPSAIP
jgi:hypothetical protein